MKVDRPASKRWWDTTFAVELLLLMVAGPVLYFPSRFPLWAIYASFAVLVLGWFWRRRRLGIWFRRTPADYPIFFLFLVMLPISLWAAPEPLRIQYSIPKAYILVWNFFLFWTIVTHASRSWRLAQVAMAGFIAAGMLIAVVAPFGTDWIYKFPSFGLLLSQIPSPLVGVFQGAESGFHPNQVAGTLLHVLPLVLALTVGAIWDLNRSAHRTTLQWIIACILFICAVFMGLVLFLTQSRAGLAGLAVGVTVMVLVNWRWGRWLLLAGFLALIVILILAPTTVVELVADAPQVEALGGATSLGFRQEIWRAAIWGLQDFPVTGMGLGTFREIARLLYPLNVAPGYDIAHAHNIFMQIGLDFGVPGMVAVLSLHLIMIPALVSIWHSGRASFLARGFLGALVAESIYGQLDAVAFGAKPNVVLWYLLAMILSILILTMDTCANDSTAEVHGR